MTSLILAREDALYYIVHVLGERIDETIKWNLLKARECGGIENTAFTIAGAKGIILNIDKTCLSEYGGHLNLTRAWAKSLLTRMGFVKRHVMTRKG